MRDCSTESVLRCARYRLLVGDGARQWALKRGLSAAQSQDEAKMWNVTKAAWKQWKSYKDMIDEEQPAWEIPQDNERPLLQPQLPKKRQKTVVGVYSLRERHKSCNCIKHYTWQNWDATFLRFGIARYYRMQSCMLHSQETNFGKWARRESFGRKHLTHQAGWSL